MEFICVNGVRHGSHFFVWTSNCPQQTFPQSILICSIPSFTMEPFLDLLFLAIQDILQCLAEQYITHELPISTNLFFQVNFISL